ncbi:hypothetical protein QCA50_019867 [Cerrena zonata]|uniref:Uncharacterized protein n=1 Tax=Cerrena zonata TaxID=2478898 RepID=A0AAW0F9X4_9APHY
MIMRLSIVFATLSPFLQAATAVPVSTTVLTSEGLVRNDTISTPVFETRSDTTPSLTHFSQSGTLPSSVVDSTLSGVTSAFFISYISSTHPPKITENDNDNDDRGRKSSTTQLLSNDTQEDGPSVISCLMNSSITPISSSSIISEAASGVVHYGASSPTDGTAHRAFTHDRATASFVPHTTEGPVTATVTVTHFSCPTPTLTTTLTEICSGSAPCSVTSNSANVTNGTSMDIPNPSATVASDPHPSTVVSSVVNTPIGGAVSSIPYRSDIVSYFLNDTGVITAVPFGLHEFSQVGIVKD